MKKPQRRRVQISANELENADVKRISLVDRGANRIPFRIMKSEDPEMGISLTGLFKQKSEESLSPMVAAIAIAKNDHTDSLLAQVKEQFGDPAEIDDSDQESIILKYEAFDAETAKVVKMTDDLAAVIGNVSKTFQPFPGSSSFSENAKSMSFLPGLRMGMDALSETVFSIMSAADSQDQLKEDVGKAVSEFGDFVTTMVSEIPVTAFKLEDMFAEKAADPDEDKSEDTKVEEAEKTEATEDKKEVKKTAGATEEEKEQDEKDDEQLAGIMNSALESMSTKMDATLGQFMDGMMKELDSRLETVQKTNDEKKDELTQKLNDTLSRVEKAEEAVRGTVVGGSHLSDESLGNRQSRQKGNGEDLDRPGIFDNAFALPGWDR